MGNWNKTAVDDTYVFDEGRMESALLERYIEIEAQTEYLPAGGELLFRARYQLPDGENLLDWLTLEIGPVPEREAAEAREQMEDEVYPALVRWMDRIARLPEDSPQWEEELFFSASCPGGRLCIESNPEE